MKDYLSNLCARSFDLVGDLPIVSPRLPAVFEPPPPAPGRVDESLSALEIPADGFGKAGDKEALRQAEHITAESNESESEPTAGANNESPLHTDRANLCLPAEDTPAAALPSPALPALRNASSAEIGIQPSIETLSAEKRLLQPIIISPAESRQVPRFVAGKEQPRHQSSQRSQRIGENASRAKEATEREGETEPFRHPTFLPTGIQDGQNARIPMPAGILFPSTGPGLSTEKKMDHRSTVEGAGPTINVTIGRIEVRAMPPTAQTRPKQKDADAMSLDEYLRHRTRGCDQ
jgi:hypothetical protein